MRYNSKDIISDSGRRAIGFPLLFVQETKRVNTVSLTFALGSALGTDPTDDVDWERFAA